MAAAENLAEQFLEQSPACNWILDAAGVFRKVYGDSVPIFGKAPAELLERRIQQALEGEPAAAWGARFTRVMGGETVRLREISGGKIWHICFFPILRAGEITHAGGLAREATAWVTAERELRHTVLGALKAMDFARTMASKFLHDTVGQNLTALGLQLDLVRMDVAPLSPEICGRLGDMQKLLETMMEEVREYSYELNPSTVERAGLRSALDRLVVRLRERFTGTLRINVDPSLKLGPKVASALYQIAQEAAENALQHSGCSTIEIAVKSTRNSTCLEVRDNGRGFDPADLESGRRGLGLLSMEHYAAEAGLELTVASNRETGTVVRASS